MTIRSRFFDSESGDRVYTSDAWAEIFSRIASEGVIPNVEDELQVVESSPEAMSVRVREGAAWIQGRFVEVYTAPEALVISAAHPTNARIDRVVLRLDYDARTATLAVLAGTPAGSPAAPALTRDATTYEISLARVAVAAAAVSIDDANITDERTDDTVCGLSELMNPDLALVVLLAGDQTINGVKTFTSRPILPASSPTTDNQAVRKKYVDDLVAAVDLSTLVPKSLGDNKGDLIGFSADNTPVKIPKAASDGKFAKSLASATGGIEWGDPPAGAHFEAKETPGASAEETVTWTTAFAATPVVVVSAIGGSSGAGRIASVSSRSTTGASLYSNTDSGSNASVVKMAIAREAT